MRAFSPALLGIFAFLLAGFVRGMEGNSNDDPVVFAAFYALLACGLIGVLAAGVAIGIRLARD